jgi:hypothetical protein
VRGIARVRQIGSLELIDQERDALVAVAAMGVARMGQEADHCLVELDPLRTFRPVGGDCALGALRRDRAGAVGQQETQQRLECELSRRIGLGTEQRQVGDVGQRAGADDLVVRKAAEARLGMPRGVD